MKDLIEEAASNGCRLAPACAELEISLRTYQRWTREDGTGMADGRRDAPRAALLNLLAGAARGASRRPSAMPVPSSRVQR